MLELKLKETELKGTKLAQFSHKLPSKLSSSTDLNARAFTNTHTRMLW